MVKRNRGLSTKKFTKKVGKNLQKVPDVTIYVTKICYTISENKYQQHLLR